MSPEEQGYEEVLRNTVTRAEGVLRAAHQALVMLKDAERRAPIELPPDLRGLLASFAPLGEADKQLLKLENTLGKLSTFAFGLGVRLTHVDIRSRLSDLGLTG